MTDTKTETKIDLNKEVKEPVHLCLRCGKILKSATSIQLGFGHICYQKFKEEHKNKMRNLF